MNQSLFDFAEKESEKYFFYFSVLKFPKEFFFYARKKNVTVGQYVIISEKEKAVRNLMAFGYSEKKAAELIEAAINNENKGIVYNTYSELPIF